MEAELIATRRQLHATPEVGLHLPRTQRHLVERLADAGIELTTGHELTSVTAIVRGTAAATQRRTVMVRSDMDALPLPEETGLPFAATNGAAHACGHDLHMAIVLHAALEAHRRRDELAGDVVFVFQPGEEGYGGAQLMIEEGVLRAFDRRPGAVLGLHVLAHHLPPGAVLSRPGPVFAGSTLLDVHLAGLGGHGSAPHLSRSPLVAAADLVTATLAAFASRISAFETAVLSYGLLHAGAARNVIPSSAELAGVIRSFDASVSREVEELIHRTARAVELAHQVQVDVRARVDTLPTATAPAEWEFLQRELSGRVGHLETPLAISEDFSWFLDKVPGAFLLVGAATGDPATSPSNHSAAATFSETVLAPTRDLVVDWVIARLAPTYEATP